MKSFHAWITVVTAMYEPDVIKGLVTKGYNVAAATGNKVSVQSKDSISAIMAFKLSKDQPDVTCLSIYNDMTFIFANIKAKYYSIVVAECSDQNRWGASNIYLPTEPTEEIKPLAKKLN